ncbi:hypothetical protein EVA_20062 [gut metagenome]|uniref:Uncharacterized protein n=1 Tax=gut metagenome TaxID=749906 RepID=J9FBL8_9ZZZZ
MSPTFIFTDLSHRRTCRSAYGGSYFGRVSSLMFQFLGVSRFLVGIIFIIREV